ncbi:VOC family protein [Undibacterium sp. Ren11W]|uniref:VOC family protein n=1 Tax=Undibacterium sp. Ren11W TaxID=3413045 RepID=UPI003BF458C9
MSSNPATNPAHSITPYLILDQAAQAIEFYTKVFGARELVRLADPDGKIMHAEIQIGAATLMLADEFPDMGYLSPKSLGGSPVSILLYVAGVDTVFASAIAAGASEKMPLSDQFDGERRGTLNDPYGHVWILAERQEQISYAELKRRFEQMMATDKTEQ